MILSRITAKAQTTVPLAVRRALRLGPGDELAWQVDGDRVVLSKINMSDPFENPFATFSEWADEHDSVYDNL